MSMKAAPATPNWRRIETFESRRMKGRIWSSTRATACTRWLGSVTMRRTLPAPGPAARARAGQLALRDGTPGGRGRPRTLYPGGVGRAEESAPAGGADQRAQRRRRARSDRQAGQAEQGGERGGVGDHLGGRSVEM